MDAALRRAVPALQTYKRAGNPIAVWQEDKLIGLKPEDIPNPYELCNG